ncbi:MAG: hypothetical protein JRJ45_00550 [Deltaproteobacteria bacterium]|nr:hypothetical protein [Deltaproteobacteria bacterium]
MAQGRITFARSFARHGMPATLIRIGPPALEIPITVLRRYAEESPVAHEISQQDTRFTLEYADLVSKGFPVPPKKGDRILKTGDYFTISLVRPLETHGELVGYEVRTTGG